MSNKGQRGGGARGGDRGGRGGPPGRGGGRGFTPQSSDGFGGGRASPPFRGGPPGRGASTSGGFEHRGRGGPPGGGGGGFRGGPRGRGGGPVIFAENAPAQTPPRLTDASHAELINAFKSLKIIPDRPLRPGFGTLGNPITLRVNFFPMRLPKGPIYDYNVEISPKTDINRIKARVFQLMELSAVCQPHLPYIAHDRSQRLVSAQKLPQPLDIHVPFYEEHEQGADPRATVYTVSITYRDELKPGDLTDFMSGKSASRDYDPQPLVSALNLVLQQLPSRTGVQVGASA